MVNSFARTFYNGNPKAVLKLATFWHPGFGSYEAKEAAFREQNRTARIEF
jgi:hypothetical protein